MGIVTCEEQHGTRRNRLNVIEWVKAIDVSLLDANLLDATVRFVRLLDSPTEAHVLAPLIKREIIYRLLMGAQGNRLGSSDTPMIGSPTIGKSS